MLPYHLKPESYDLCEKEPWEEYCARHGIDPDRPSGEFIHQVLYDDFDGFNERYPDFDLSRYRCRFVKWPASRLVADIRIFNNQDVMRESQRFEKTGDIDNEYVLYQEMRRLKTWPYPIIVLDSANLLDDEWRVYGRPYHVIEGRHRLYYLTKMMDAGQIARDSQRRIVLVEPGQPSTQH